MASRRKATSKAMGSRKVESFAGDLFYFIWNELEGGIPAKPQVYRLEKDQPSTYTPEIGKMVLKMQIDFRDNLQELFSKHLNMRMERPNFFEFVKNNLKLLNPTDVFDRTCASCAFFSEFALYHFTKQNKDYLETAPIMWSNFFHKNLRGKFNISGGWAEFQKRAATSATVESGFAEAPTPSGIERLQIAEAPASIPSQVTSIDDQSVPPGDVTAESSFEVLPLGDVAVESSFEVLPLGPPTNILALSPEDKNLSEKEETFLENTEKGFNYVNKMRFLAKKVRNPNIDEYFLKKLAEKFLKIDIGDESEPNRPPPVSEASVSAISTTLPSTSGASEHQGVKPKSRSSTRKTAMPAIKDPRTGSRRSKKALRKQLLKYFEDQARTTEQALQTSLDLIYQKMEDEFKIRETQEDSESSQSSKETERREL